MSADIQDWQKVGKAKLESINDSIPKPWRVDPLPSNEQQRDVTGDFIRQYLSKDEIDLTEASATTIVDNISAGQWTAEAVARAFCHRASLAHQLVMGTPSKMPVFDKLTDLQRPTVCMKPFLTPPSKMLNAWMNIIHHSRNQSVPCMAYPSA